MINDTVFLQKNLRGPGFNILDSRLKLLYKELQFVWMKDVSFIICEKNLKLFLDTGKQTDHAWVEGILIDALPIHLRLSKDKLDLINGSDKWVTLKYVPRANKGFVIETSGDSVVSAKEIIAYKGKLRAKI